MITTHLYEFFFGYIKANQMRIVDDSLSESSYIINEFFSRVTPTKGTTMSCNSNFTQANGYCPVIAGTTPVYTGQLVDSTLTPIGSSALNTMTITLTDSVSNSIVNNVNNVNILNTGRGTIDSNGFLTIAFLPGDMMLFNPNNLVEERQMLITYTFNGNTKAGAKIVFFTVTAS